MVGSVALREKEGASLVLTVPFLTVLQLPQEMLPLRQKKYKPLNTTPNATKEIKVKSASHHSVSLKWEDVLLSGSQLFMGMKHFSPFSFDILVSFNVCTSEIPSMGVIQRMA